MRAVEKNPDIQRSEVPEEVHDAIFAEIRRKEEAWEREQRMIEQLSSENKELLRLGKVYKRNLRFRKYILLAAVFVLTMAFGITSFGSVERMFHRVSSMIGNRTRETVDTDGVKELSYLNEEEVFAQIEQMYGVFPVRMGYLPEGTELLEANVLEETGEVNVIYGTSNKTVLIYEILIDYQEKSWSKDIEDQLVAEFIETNNDMEVEVKQYLLSDNTVRWQLQFERNEIYYWVQVIDVDKETIHKIIDYFKFA